MEAKHRLGASRGLQLRHRGAQAAVKTNKIDRQRRIANWASGGKHQYWGIETVERLSGLTLHYDSDSDDNDLGDGGLNKEELMDNGQGKRQNRRHSTEE